MRFDLKFVFVVQLWLRDVANITVNVKLRDD